MKKYAVLGFLFFTLLTFFVYFGFLRSIDFRFTVFLQKLIPNIFTTSFSLFSVLGSIEFATVILLLILVLLPRLNKISVLFMYGLFSVVEVLGKSFISQKGPPIQFLKTDIHLFLPVSSSVPKDFFSYPSGHSSRTAFISGVILIAIWQLDISKKQKYLASLCVLIFDIVMFISRVYLGEHWVSDVIGGLLLGFSFAFLYPFLASISRKAFK